MTDFLFFAVALCSFLAVGLIVVVAVVCGDQEDVRTR